MLQQPSLLGGHSALVRVTVEPVCLIMHLNCLLPMSCRTHASKIALRESGTWRAAFVTMPCGEEIACWVSVMHQPLLVGLKADTHDTGLSS